MTEPFFEYKNTVVDIDEPGVLVLQSAYDRLEPMMLEITNELLTSDAPIPHLPAALFPSLLAQGLIADSISVKCPICEPSGQEKILEALERTEDVYSEFLARQFQLVKHVDTDHATQAENAAVLLDRELDRYRVLSLSVKTRAHDALKRLNMLEAAGMSMQVERYHPDAIGGYLFMCGVELWDCLGRSTLHSWLDYMYFGPDQADLKLLQEDSLQMTEAVKAQDILGRSPLHIACQKGWKEGVEALLELGADPKATTVYGSSPLHYAAANGSAEICEILLGHVTLADIKRDCRGEIPVAYARKNKHTKAVDAFKYTRLGGRLGGRNYSLRVSPPPIRALPQEEFNPPNRLTIFELSGQQPEPSRQEQPLVNDPHTFVYGQHNARRSKTPTGSLINHTGLSPVPLTTSQPPELSREQVPEYMLSDSSLSNSPTSVRTPDDDSFEVEMLDSGSVRNFYH